MRTLAIFFAVLVGLATPAQAIVYDVNRTIGAGTVVGTITTDDTIGALVQANISAWAFTITAPNLLGGPSVAISSASGNIFQPLNLGLTATLTDITFDFSAANAGIGFFNSTNTIGWCLAGIANCTGGGNSLEQIGDASGGAPIAQSVNLTGPMVVATTVSPVPIPAIFPIFAAVMGLFGFVGWRRRRKLAVA